MVGPGGAMAEPQDDNPERFARAARALLYLSPFLFAFTYGLAAIQGADTRSCLIISGVGLAMCLGASLLYHLRGSKAGSDMAWIALILRLIARR
jgi:hypothetical protein